MEKRRIVNTDDYYKYNNAIEEYCAEIERVRKIVWIKVAVLAVLCLIIVFGFRNLPSVRNWSEFAAKNFGQWIVMIPMFLIGKNLGQNKKIIDIAKTAKKEMKNMMIAEDVVSIESCFVDKTFAHNYRCLFLRVSTRYVLVSDKDEHYYILKKPEQQFYIGDPSLVKIIYTVKSRIVVDYNIIKGEKYNQGVDTELDINEKIKRIERCTESVWTYKDVKLPYIKFTYNGEADVYFMADVFFDGTVDKKLDIEINITCRKIGNEIKKYLEDNDSVEIENHKEQIGKIITNVINNEMPILKIKSVEYDYVIRKREDGRKFIEL